MGDGVGGGEERRTGEIMLSSLTDHFQRPLAVILPTSGDLCSKWLGDLFDRSQDCTIFIQSFLPSCEVCDPPTSSCGRSCFFFLASLDSSFSIFFACLSNHSSLSSCLDCLVISCLNKTNRCKTTVRCRNRHLEKETGWMNTAYIVYIYCRVLSNTVADVRMINPR